MYVSVLNNFMGMSCSLDSNSSKREFDVPLTCFLCAEWDFFLNSFTTLFNPFNPTTLDFLVACFEVNILRANLIVGHKFKIELELVRIVKFTGKMYTRGFRDFFFF